MTAGQQQGKVEEDLRNMMHCSICRERKPQRKYYESWTHEGALEEQLKGTLNQTWNLKPTR